ncbi:hypothetical protein IU427_33755 [Nocardia beijingensis]|uniref:hypothetical protein n=1 Tax=Nocardia beijingensis TaxID=95162 RepID=UPI001894DAE3|nr:hypothetical protein [Nocardia beijingensis]MBF6470082.1 hypothetical protein [Nocardia beijingensis]
MGLLTDAANQHPLPDEMPAAALWSRVQLQTPTSDNGATNSLTSGLTGQAESNPLMLLTDEELDQHISELHQQLALVDTDAFIFSPATHRHEEPDPEDTARRHRAAQEAIRNAQHADHQLEAAVEAAGTAATELHDARDELAATPRYRRGHRRQLQARIDTLIVERNIRDRHHNSARTNARNAHREAVLVAGPEDDWHHQLTRHPQPPPNEQLPESQVEATVDEEASQRTTYFRQQLDEYHAEQHRRSTLELVAAGWAPTWSRCSTS